jgi:murein DD-endopeptidase MepM/ murein hydrolase activator NlpD
MFWGRGGLYKSSFHISVVFITLFLLITNFASRLAIVQRVEAEEELAFSYASAGNSDLLQQGNSLKSITAIDPGFPEFSVRKYEVKPGDDLNKLAKDFEVSKDTIKWANSKILSPFNDTIQAGWILDIPEMDGVLYTVVANDSIDKVVEKTGGDKASIVELNRILPPDYKLDLNQRLFVPDGKLKPAAPPKSVVANSTYRAPKVDYTAAYNALLAMPAGSFGNPMAQCGGYSVSRSISAYHNGIDLSHAPGCMLVSAAAGTVKFVGWHSLSGWHVVIEHGSGIRTNYFHGQPNTFQVRTGDYVYKGQPLMKLGCSGRCTGPHLHFELVVGGKYLEPRSFVPL